MAPRWPPSRRIKKSSAARVVNTKGLRIVGGSVQRSHPMIAIAVQLSIAILLGTALFGMGR